MNKKNFALLGTIIAAMGNADTPYHMATIAAVAALAKETPPMVETNDAIKDGDKVAVRASDAGVAFFNDPANKAKYEAPSAPREKPVISTGSGFVVTPELAKRSVVKSDLYNFDALNVGDVIFVNKTEARPDPAKSLASTVSAATKKYAVEIPGQTRVARGGKVVPATRNTRVFGIFTMTAGQTAGSYTAPADGAAIVRLPDAEAPAA